MEKHHDGRGPEDDRCAGGRQADGLRARRCRAREPSTMLAGEPVERMDLDEAHMRADLAEFVATSSTDGGVVLGRGGVIVLADAPTALHVLLSGSREGRVARAAEREGIDHAEADRR